MFVLAALAAPARRVLPRTALSPERWIYSKVVQYEYPQGVTSNDGWITFDGTKTPY